ncbi:sodium-dependent nutrient amino acid transporter 1-like isoform X1 [Colletes gigas]|uniref:sodium-dependent nutrient amino acid transporter 1-like isoform X1 n=1 Tax=Colletes gigas TaxID=935657 RepID=UPI001C9A87C9|nr:sodium-dependent nutrient amino acid transporter 1-like isoform X1 [Colletes gigas]
MRKYTSNGVQNGHRNAAFVADEEDQNGFRKDSGDSIARYSVTSEETEAKRGWNNSIEFLMSCIAMSIGFGNIWRFPFTAYENGGGVFLIPYIIVLFLIGKPFYYLEMIIGQFSSSTSIKVWSLSPAFVGVGWAQLCSNVALMTYYSSLMALTLFFLIASFSSELPWAKCREEWGDHCVDSSTKANISANSMGAFEGARSEGANVFDLLVTDEQFKSSAELYFLKVVLQEKDSIDDGIGLPDWKLTLCLLGSWLSVILITFQGVKSSGKASYFLAIFPYIVLVSLLIRAVTLDGAGNGILYFITPKWSKLSDLTVWYAAVTQCFFSLSVCFGTIITYSSHNDFKHNIYRDAMIVTSLDTVTSMIAGCTIFGILGNLAHEMGITDIDKVVRSGAGLAFVSYPDAIAKFDVVPQVFAVLFFVMMFVLGVGSNVGMVSGVVIALKDKLPNVKLWQIVISVCSMGFAVSTVYVTPGGQFLLTLVDYYGTSFVVFILASFEITAVVWLYGIENFIDDIEFMLEKKTSIYWNVCWFLVTPLILIIIFIYTVATLSPVTYGGKDYPASAHVAGVIILCIGVFQIPFWMVAEMVKNRRLPFLQNIKASFQPTSEWGPRKTKYKDAWLLFKEQKTKERSLRTQPRWLQLICILLRVKMK